MRNIKITELAGIFGTNIVVMFVPGRNPKWYAHFEDSDTKDGPSDHFLCGTTGDGNTANEAINDYAKRIAGRVVVLHAGSENRKEFNCPKEVDGI